MFLIVTFLISVVGVAIWIHVERTRLERDRQRALKRPPIALSMRNTTQRLNEQGPPGYRAPECPPVSWRDTRDDYVAPATWVDPTPSYDSSPSYSSCDSSYSSDTSSYSDSSSSSDCGSSSCSCD